MALPITGPFSATLGDGTNFRHYKKGYKQARPYNLPLVYESRLASRLYAFGTHASYQAQGMLNDDRVPIPGNNTSVYSQAYAKMLDKARPSVSLGAALAEASSSVAMIAGRALQLSSAFRSLLRADVRGVAKALNVRPVNRSKRSVRQDLQGTWLEYAFGWKPLVGDIYGAVDVLQHDFGTVPVQAHASEQVHQPFGDIPWGNVSREAVTGSWGVRMGLTVRVTNPNLFLANQLGLVNPVSVAWELVPFSFVADWFSNVSTVINSMTDMLGWEAMNAYTTRYCKGTRNLDYWYNHVKYGSSGFQYLRMERTTSFSPPTFSINKLRIPGWQGALTRLATVGVLADIVRRR